MYLDHFGLNRPPFKITPDTRTFYPGGSRGEILEAIVYAIVNGEGIVKVVGEVGSGKTMLSRMLEIRLPNNVDIVYLANPSVAPGDIMYAITLEMGLSLPSQAGRLEALHLLQAELLSRHADGRQVVCFVEEAQAMPIETLEEIRLLSNLETHQDKLLQIVLFGQPELDDNLDGPNIRQLRERIVHSFSLAPFGVNEIREYVRFRMLGAGYRGPDVFTTGAYRKMASASFGLVRRINIIGDKALLAAYAANSYEVGQKQVTIAVKDSEFGRITRRRPVPGLAWAAAIGVFAVGVAIAGTAFVIQGPAGTVVAGAAPLPEEAAASVAMTGAPQRRAEENGPPDAVVSGEPQDLSSVRALSSSSALSSADPTAMGVVSAKPVGSAHAAASTAPAPMPSESFTCDGSGVGARTPGGVMSTTATTQVVMQPALDVKVARENTIALTPTGGRGSAEAVAMAGGPPDAPPDALMGRRNGPLANQPTNSRPALREVASLDLNATTALANVPPKQGVRSQTSGSATAMPSPSPPAGVGRDERPAPGPKVSGAPVVPVGLATAAPAGVRPPPGPSVTGAIRLQSVPAADAAGGLGAIQPRLLGHRLDATRNWLSVAARNNFSIQLMMTDGDNWRNLEQFLLRWSPKDLEAVYVYKALIRGRTWYGVPFSEYDSLKGAQVALASLPAELKRHKPYVRKISRISPVG